MWLLRTFPEEVGLNKLFRQTKRKTEGPQHFAFPEISRENRGCLVLHSGNSRVSLSLRAGLGQNLNTKNISQNLSEAKLRKSTKYPGGRRVISRSTRVLRKIPRHFDDLEPKIWLILGPNQPQTRLRAKNLTISTEFSRENREEKRGCCREKRKGKQTGCERKTSYSLTGNKKTVSHHRRRWRTY